MAGAKDRAPKTRPLILLVGVLVSYYYLGTMRLYYGNVRHKFASILSAPVSRETLLMQAYY